MSIAGTVSLQLLCRHSFHTEYSGIQGLSNFFDPRIHLKGESPLNFFSAYNSTGHFCHVPSAIPVNVHGATTLTKHLFAEKGWTS